MNPESHTDTGKLAKVAANLPWLWRYPFVRVADILNQNAFEKKHLIISVADHFEPAWTPDGVHPSVDQQLRRLDRYIETARRTGRATLDNDGTMFRHTNFYPAEQYDARILDKCAEMQSEGLGEVEIHLHHGVDHPDTSENLRAVLTDFRDTLAERHKCLSRMPGSDTPMYAFVHGNLALANSNHGKFCGVDDEMQILQETGCYADMTLPSAPDPSQVSTFNRIYECGDELDKASPHNKGRRLSVGGARPQLPVIINGPLILRMFRSDGTIRPGIEDGALSAAQGTSDLRTRRWVSAGVTVDGRSDWVFIKLYCHGFFDEDQPYCIGDKAAAFFSELVEQGDRTGAYKVHFASARETFNMISAAVERRSGDPDQYRDHLLRPIMNSTGFGAGASS